jgi:two-component system response regulator DevR
MTNPSEPMTNPSEPIAHPSEPMAHPPDRRITRVFVLDDHEIVRRGVIDLINSDSWLEVVGEAGTAVDATMRILATRPDVAILDGRLPDGSGIEVCREVRAADPRIRCLILTSYNDDEAVFAAVLAGASGYVLKQIRAAHLLDAVHQVAAGRSLLDPDVTESLLRRIRSGPQEDPRLAGLTEQERRILELITDGLTNREIGATLYLAEKTVKNNVSVLLAKLGMQRRTQVAVLGAQISQRPTPVPSSVRRSAIS